MTSPDFTSSLTLTTSAGTYLVRTSCDSKWRVFCVTCVNVSLFATTVLAIPQDNNSNIMAPPGNQSNHRVFGQATRSNKGSSRYQRQLGGGSGNSHSLIASANSDVQLTEQQRLAQKRAEYKKRRQQEGEELDTKFGYERFGVSTARPGETRRGWLFNLLPTVCCNCQQ
jgi:hypothetical protein